ncbi:MAG TPA: tRNA glutamyl-Q(34) synthetase GluQRS [Thermoanaerobaculia bacterium]|nr:tRNA glutamyl-Q(34) synthetase GluQRS [Thermoanaerobaculia bacterium]
MPLHRGARWHYRGVIGAGRFAPSPTGPLHVGSLVAALGSYLFARSSGRRFLVRIEDLDTPRVVPGAEREILLALERYGLTWDGEVVRQSERTFLYEEALASLRARGLVFPCACSRAEIARASSAPTDRDPVDAEGPVYPGTCRPGLPEGRAPRAIRFHVPPGVVAWEDAVFGPCEEETSRAVGDFVVKRADGPFAYQLAVVVDDAVQGVTEVVRGADLLSSTGRQILLQRALGYATPAYAHLPLVIGKAGAKLGKRDGALPLETLNEARVRETLTAALGILGQEASEGSPSEVLAEAVRSFRPERIPRGPVSA